MSSRRKLKKNINELMEMLYTDCVLYKVFVVGADKTAADKIIEKIADKHLDLITRVSVTEGKDAKGRVKAYYKKLRADVVAQANAIAKEIAVLP